MKKKGNKKGTSAIVWISKKAKELRAKNKSLSQQQAVKEASQLYRKEKK